MVSFYAVVIGFYLQEIQTGMKHIMTYGLAHTYAPGRYVVTPPMRDFASSSEITQ